MQDLILNFDKKPDYKEKFEAEMNKRPKLGTFRPSKAEICAVAMKDEIPLGVVNEEAEDEVDQSTHKMTPVTLRSAARSNNSLFSPSDGPQQFK